MQHRICLITPGHLAMTPRIVKEADALAEHGYEVSVISGNCIAWARAADQEFAGRPWHLTRVLPFGSMAPVGRRAVQIIRQRTAKVLFHIGVTEPHIRRAAWHPIGPDLINAAMEIPANLYIAHYIAALPAAALAARRHGALYAFDAEDFHLGDLPDTSDHADQKSIIHSIEREWLPGCAYISAASPGIAKAYAAAYGVAEPHVVLNVFPLGHAPTSATVVGTARPSPSIYWFSQTIGPDRGLQCAVRALGLATTKPHLHLRGILAAGFEDRLRSLATQSGVEDRIHFIPPAAPSEMARLAAEYDAGFSGEIRDTQNREIALANKLFVYLLAGLPILMSDIPAHRDLASELGSAARLYETENPQSLASAIDDLLCDRTKLAEARTKAFALGQRRFNWDVEKDQLLELVGRALSRAG